MTYKTNSNLKVTQTHRMDYFMTGKYWSVHMSAL